MPHGDVETYHSEGHWKNRIEGEQDLPGTYETKDEAVRAGREAAKANKVEHIIRNLDGRIGERDSWGVWLKCPRVQMGHFGRIAEESVPSVCPRAAPTSPAHPRAHTYAHIVAQHPHVGPLTQKSLQPTGESWRFSRSRCVQRPTSRRT